MCADAIVAPTPQQDYLAHLRTAVQLARSWCADLVQVQYWNPARLVWFADDFRWCAQFYAEVLKSDELQALDLAAEIGFAELRRRDDLCKTEPAIIRAGYVYLLSSPFGYYKIGCSSKPKNRLLTFGVQLPFEVECLCTIYAADMYALEKELHQRFAYCRTRGEWFSLSDQDVAYVKGMATP